MWNYWPPILGISGFKNSGKTTLIESLLPLLHQSHFKVAVIKHHGHRMEMEVQNKDSVRFFQAGADSWLHDGKQLVYGGQQLHDLHWLVQLIPGYYDLILVEGHKQLDMPRIWLSKKMPKAEENVIVHLPSWEQRTERAWKVVQEWLRQQWYGIKTSIVFMASQQNKHRQDYVGLSHNMCEQIVIWDKDDVEQEISATPESFFLSKQWQVLSDLFGHSSSNRWLIVPESYSGNQSDLQNLLNQCPVGAWAWQDSISNVGIYYPQLYHLWQAFSATAATSAKKQWWHNKIAIHSSVYRIL